MSRRKISLNEIGSLFAEGKGVSEIAKKTGFTKGAISKALKRLNINATKSVTLYHAGEVVKKELNVVEQLQKINENANELLDLLMRWNKGDDEALQILEGQVRKVKVRGTEEEITEYKFKDPRELALKAMAEIRAQLNLQLEIFKTLYDYKAVAEFQREVLTAIREVAPDVRNRIIQNLKKAGAIQGVFL
jgi:hypothetical protein